MTILATTFTDTEKLMKKVNNTMKVMTVHKRVIAGDYAYCLMGADEPTHILVDNHKSKTCGMLLPLSAMKSLLEGEV